MDGMKIYPKETLDQDLQKLKLMDIPSEEKTTKGNALVSLFYNQEKKNVVEPFAIRDYRENILGKDSIE